MERKDFVLSDSIMNLNTRQEPNRFFTSLLNPTKAPEAEWKQISRAKKRKKSLVKRTLDVNDDSRTKYLVSMDIKKQYSCNVVL